MADQQGSYTGKESELRPDSSGNCFKQISSGCYLGSSLFETEENGLEGPGAATRNAEEGLRQSSVRRLEMEADCPEGVGCQVGVSGEGEG